MIIFDQLRISDDGKRMYINVHVNKADYFKYIVINKIVIMTADKVSETNPNAPTEDYIYKNELEGKGQREVNLVLTANDFTTKHSNLSEDLFFVYVECSGTPMSNTPCRLDEPVTVGVVFDENLLYQRAMDFTKDLVADCKEPTAFVDFILLWNAFKYAIETEHYIAAIKFYNMLFGGQIKEIRHIKTCGCHG